METIRTFAPYGPCPICSTVMFDRRGNQVAHDVEFVGAKVPGWLGRLFGRRPASAHLSVTCRECGYSQNVPVGAPVAGAPET